MKPALTTAGTLRPAPRRAFRHQWLVPGGLILLSAIPVLAGTVRLTDLAGSAEITPGNARFFTTPVPVVLHITSATLYSLVGAFQFVPALRRARSGRFNWHQAAGRFLIPAGIVVALTGLWMAVFYDLPASDGLLLLILRLAAGTGMLASITLGILALRARDFIRHGAWMTRAYAIAAGAGTQALILIVPELLTGPPDVTGRAVLMGAGWALNLAVAEYAIRRRPARPAGAPGPAPKRAPGRPRRPAGSHATATSNQERP